MISPVNSGRYPFLVHQPGAVIQREVASINIQHAPRSSSDAAINIRCVTTFPGRRETPKVTTQKAVTSDETSSRKHINYYFFIVHPVAIFQQIR